MSGGYHAQQSQARSELLDRVAEGFATVASRIRTGSSDQEILHGLHDAQMVCEQLAQASTGERHSLAVNLRSAAETWHSVWPRLGSRAEFRQAVAREADLWARRLQTMWEKPGSPRRS